VFRRVLLPRFLGVVRGVQRVPMRDMRVVSRLLVIASSMVLGGLTMVMRGMLMMLSSLRVVLGFVVHVFHGCASPKG
jgi:hypothetical protein